MKLKSILIALIPFSIIASCTVLSFYPLYTENELIKDDRILGNWLTVSDSNALYGTKIDRDTIFWKIEFREGIWKKKLNNPFDRGSKQVNNKFTYTMTMHYNSFPEDSAIFHLHLVKLDDKTYLDFYLEEWNFNNTLLAVHLMPVHTFAKIEIGEKLEINWFDSEWLQTLFDTNKIRIKHENNGVNTLLTAKPKELQKFVIKYADEENAFSEDMQYILSRQ